MPALPAAVSTYMTTITDSLKDHASDDATVDVQPYQFIRAMHLSAALELLQNACSQPSARTATGGTTTTLLDTGAFTANALIGSYIVFGAATTTVALRGLSYRVIANTTGAVTFGVTLAGTPVAGDTYTVVAGFLNETIADLREGKGLGDSPAGDIWGDYRVVINGINKGLQTLGATLAERTVYSGVTATGSTTTTIALNLRGGALRIDELAGLKLKLTGSNPVKIISNTEAGVCTVSMPVSGGAPAAAVVVSVTVPSDSTDFRLGRDVHPGAHQSNYVLANLLAQLQAAVVAYTLPA